MTIFLMKVRDVFKSMWKWIKEHWSWVVGGISLLALMFLTARAISKGKNGKLKSEILKHQVAVLAAQREVARLEGQREVIRIQEGEVSAEIAELDVKIDTLNTQIVSTRSEIDKLSAEEKLQRFKELGY